MLGKEMGREQMKTSKFYANYSTLSKVMSRNTKMCLRWSPGEGTVRTFQGGDGLHLVQETVVTRQCREASSLSWSLRQGCCIMCQFPEQPPQADF